MLNSLNKLNLQVDITPKIQFYFQIYNISGAPMTNFIENLTRIEEDRRKDVFSDTDDILKWISKVTIEVVTVVSILSVVLNIFACIIVFKSRRLRTDTRYKLLAVWFLLNILFLLSLSIFIRAFFNWDDAFISLEGFCIVAQLQSISFNGLIFATTLLTCHWYLKLNNPSKFMTFNRTIMYYIYGLIVFLFLCFLEGFVGCFFLLRSNHYYNNVLMIICFVIFNIFMVVINFRHCFDKGRINNDSEIRTTYLLSNIFFILHLPLGIFLILYAFIGNFILFLTLCIYLKFTISCPIYFFVILYKYDKFFNTSARHLIKCNCSGYAEDELN